MYIKIKSMRLDWYSNPENQNLIRAELYQVTTHSFFVYFFVCKLCNLITVFCLNCTCLNVSRVWLMLSLLERRMVLRLVRELCYQDHSQDAIETCNKGSLMLWLLCSVLESQITSSL
jgi:hypothetical protein